MLRPPRTPMLTGRQAFGVEYANWSVSFWLLVVMDERKEHELITIEILTI